MRGRKTSAESVNDTHLTKMEREVRSQVEAKLRGSADKLKAPDYLTKSQRSIFNFVLKEMDGLNLFGNVDIYLLAQYAICADTLINIEIDRQDPDRVYAKDLISARKTYSADFLKYGLELGLSPQARAKVGTYAAEQKKVESNPVLGILNAK